MAGSLTLPPGLAGIGAAARRRPRLPRPPARPAMALYGGALAIALVVGGLDGTRSRMSPQAASGAVSVPVAVAGAQMQAQPVPPADTPWNPRPAALGLAVEAEGLIRTLGSVDPDVEATAVAQLL